MAHPSSARIIDVYEEHAVDYDRDRTRSLFERSWLDRFLGLLPRGASVLDVGCGSGEPMAGYLIATGCRVTGIDSSTSMIEICRRRFPEHRWMVADMRGLDLGETFAGLLAWDSFFHLTADDQRTMFPLFASHARPGAALMFTSGPRAGEAIGSYRGQDLYHASLDPAEYEDLLEANGFSVVRFTPEDEECGGHTIWLAQATGRS